MLPDVSFVIPTWNRAHTLDRCIGSLVDQSYPGSLEIVVVDDRSTDNTVGLVQKWRDHIAPKAAYPRPIRLTYGPGRSNWRPGAIHRPFFEHCLMSKARFVGYQFSDDYSDMYRVESQVRAMMDLRKHWSFCRHSRYVDLNEKLLESKTHDWDRERDLAYSRGPTLPVFGFLIERDRFILAGGCDYPLHAGANAEAWIIAHCAMTSDPAIAECPMYFRVHDEALGNKQKPGSDTYKKSIAETGFLEEDHWHLWGQIDSIYIHRLFQARK